MTTQPHTDPLKTPDFAAYDDPIDRIVWRHVDELNHNDYNPNVVMTAELRLIEHSILTTGWLQPVTTLPDGTIIDGFHRYMLSRESQALREQYAGRVPCVVLDLSRAEAMLLTIRINRAKGSHVALRMSSIVKELIDEHGLDPAEIQRGIGASKDEVDLLYQDGIFQHRNLKDYRYSKAWVPHEDGKKS